MDFSNIFSGLKTDSDLRFDEFDIESIEKISSLDRIEEEAYLEKPTWLGGDEKFACLSIDLDKSAKHSVRKDIATMAKIYDYFTQNVVDILSIEEMRANYIDIKGDGAFGIYEGESAIQKAFVAGITFKTFFKNVIKPKFQNTLGIELNCKIALDYDKILVKKIGNRKFNNEVWAGRLVNNTYKIMDLNSKIKSSYQFINDPDVKSTDSLIIVTDEIYRFLDAKCHDHAIWSCSCSGKSGNLWKKYDCSGEPNIGNDSVYYCYSFWCDNCGDEYAEEILNS